MTNPYAQFATDADKEKNGVEVDFGDYAFIVARAGATNPAYVAALERMTRPHKRAIETGTIDKKLARRLSVEAFVEGCLKGWRNVADENGKLLEFSAENAVKLFTDLPDLFALVEEAAKEAALFRRVTNEDIAGN